MGRRGGMKGGCGRGSRPIGRFGERPHTGGRPDESRVRVDGAGKAPDELERAEEGRKAPDEGRKAPDEGRKGPDLGALAASGCDRERNFHATTPRSLRRTQKALRRPAPALAGLRPPSPACARPRRPAPALAGLRPPSPACARPRRPAPALAGLRPPSPACARPRRPAPALAGLRPPSPAWAALAGLGSTRRPGQHSPAWAALAGLGSTRRPGQHQPSSQQTIKPNS